MELYKVKDELCKKGYTAVVFEKRNDAVNFLQEKLKDKSVAFGGSVTVQQLNLQEELKGYAKDIIWHWNGADPKEIMHSAFSCDAYVLSSNAMTKDGIILNLDGNGNRIAASIYGPEEVFFVVGKNKICDNIEKAYERIKNVAAPLNAKRLNKTTPCALTGKCVNCNSKESFCNVLSLHLRKPAGIKGTVVLINEDLGY